MERKTNKRGETVITKGNVRAVIRQDVEGSFNPRVDQDNLGTMVCWHRRYRLGDAHKYEDQDAFRLDLWLDHATVLEQDSATGTLLEKLSAETREKIVAHVMEAHSTPEARRRAMFEAALDWVGASELGFPDEVITIPLYLYDHGGITMSTGRFGCSWDSGQVGWIYCTRAKAVKWFGAFDETRVLTALRCEVSEYDQYLRGDVYRIDVYQGACGCDQCDKMIESNHGYLGEESAIEAAQEMIQSV